MGENSDPNTEAVSNKKVTVFDDGKNFNVKHPLEYTWTLWYDYQQRKTNQESWLDSLKKVFSFETVEDFWGLYNNILKSSQLNVGSNYHLFKLGIKPMWEDDSNKSGGKWIFQVPRKRDGKDAKQLLDELWNNVVLACIGGDFEDANDDICGIVVSIRTRQDRISLWTKTGADKEKQEKIGRKLKEILSIPADQTIGYQVHADAQRANTSFNNEDKYTV